MHLLTHEGTATEAGEAAAAELPAHLRWEPRFAATVVRLAEEAGLVERQNGLLVLTPRGRELAWEVMLYGTG